ncbi:hypothetical protein THASP1DRAFT_32366 [Thamnocephalis sphaerospora]|uniref:FYVE-type domain-containing protein n=1 Tax=Thamnocephalis sphaerospora TaxID=78915 RepID=A0A4V1IVZ7_9FUNG|nr:hypothetical protein THASP1DRAFT_32366 [Thamnocephalis sphaerospora]|eukprot:RKP05799.1 hypothetical protein THASP1DRAFT_32366 [Thamnocephalis sphaerospora]
MASLPTALGGWSAANLALSDDESQRARLTRSATSSSDRPPAPRVVFDARQSALRRGSAGHSPIAVGKEHSSVVPPWQRSPRGSPSVAEDRSAIVPPWQRLPRDSPPTLPVPPPLTPLLTIDRQLANISYAGTHTPNTEESTTPRSLSFEQTPPASITGSTTPSPSLASVSSRTLSTQLPAHEPAWSSPTESHRQVGADASSPLQHTPPYTASGASGHSPRFGNVAHPTAAASPEVLEGSIPILECPVCGQRVSTLRELNDHLDGHGDAATSPPPSSMVRQEVATPGMACPICQLPANTLAELNHHLDEYHMESSPSTTPQRTTTARHERRSSASNARPPVMQHRRSLSGNVLRTRNGESAADIQQRLGMAADSEEDFDPAQTVIDWFRQAQRKFTPAKNKLTQLAARAINSAEGTTLPGLAADPPQLGMVDVSSADEEDWMRRDHWQPHTEGATCSALGCAEKRGPLSLRTGKENCRRCGRLFCNYHCGCAMRLDESARHDPERGRWCRVCMDCFQTRPGYGDHEGKCLVRIRTNMFAESRQLAVERSNLEANRLKKRLEKLAQAYADPASVVGSALLRIKSQPQIRKHIDQAIVMWDVDTTAETCPLCGDGFTKLTKRKHHCRLCGRIVCGQTQCSRVHTVTAAGDFEYPDEALSSPVVGQMRTCATCCTIISRRHAKQHGVVKQTPLMDLYESMLVHRAAINRLLPKFNELAQVLRTSSSDAQDHLGRDRASTIRKELTDSFALYDGISKKILRLPTANDTEQRLQQAIYHTCNMFLQQYKLTLSLLPKMARSTPTQSPSVSASSPASFSASTSAHGEQAHPPTHPPPSHSAADIRATELRETLSVLRDQRERVEAYMREASERRKFEDVQTLKLSLDDLETEIERIRSELRDG